MVKFVSIRYCITMCFNVILIYFHQHVQLEVQLTNLSLWGFDWGRRNEAAG